MVLLAFVAISPIICWAGKGLVGLSIKFPVTKHEECEHLRSPAEAWNRHCALIRSTRCHCFTPPSWFGNTTACAFSWHFPYFRGAADFLPGMSEILSYKLSFEKCDGTKSTEDPEAPLWICQPMSTLVSPFSSSSLQTLALPTPLLESRGWSHHSNPPALFHSPPPCIAHWSSHISL